MGKRQSKTKAEIAYDINLLTVHIGHVASSHQSKFSREDFANAYMFISRAKDILTSTPKNNNGRKQSK